METNKDTCCRQGSAKCPHVTLLPFSSKTFQKCFPHSAMNTDVVLDPRARPSAPDPPNQAPIPYNCVSDHSSVREYVCVSERERTTETDNEDTFRDAQQELMQEQMFKILFQSYTHKHTQAS